MNKKSQKQYFYFMLCKNITQSDENEYVIVVKTSVKKYDNNKYIGINLLISLDVTLKKLNETLQVYE